MTWTEFRTEVFARIDQIVERNNCSNFVVMGYKHLDIKLVLHFADRDQVYKFRLGGDGNENYDKIIETSFFTDERDDLPIMKAFAEQWKFYKPETPVEMTPNRPADGEIFPAKDWGKILENDRTPKDEM